MSIEQAALAAIAVWFAVVLAYGLFRATKEPHETS